MSKTFSFKAHAVGPQSAEQTLMILTYEMGKVLRCSLASQVHGPKGYKGVMFQEMSDVVSMLRYYCELQELDYWTLVSTITFLEEPRDLIANMMCYVADLVQAHHYTNCFGNTRYHFKISDAISYLGAAIQLWCTIEEHSWRQLHDYGEEHYLERMQDIRERGVRK